jgi:hypothetical protein
MRNPLPGFLVRLAVIYALLIVPWPGFREGYGRYLQVLGQAVLGTDRGRPQVRFETVPATERRGLDLRVALAHPERVDVRGMVPVQYLDLDSRGIGWVPTALTLALIAATPVPWRRRGWALLAGLLAVQAYVLACLAVGASHAAAGFSPAAPATLWTQVIAALDETLVTQMGASFVVPVLIWILVTLRRQDLVRWRQADAAQGASD